MVSQALPNPPAHAVISPLANEEFENRVVARQLVLLSTPTRGAIIGMPLWAAAVCWITSGAFPALGTAPLAPSLYWLAMIIAGCLGALLVDNAYRRALNDEATFDPRYWARRYTLVLAVLSSSWASLIWVFWIEGNEINQLSLTILVFCGITNGIISRMNKFETFLLGSGLAVFILWSKFLTAQSDAASIFVLLLPLWFVAMTLNVRAASAQVRKNIATQIDNELLTAGIAKARDEAERQRLNAESANRAKSTFVANMSHELRTPLNAILGFSEIIASEALGHEAQDRYREYAWDINTSGAHLLSLINDLLDIAKIEAGKFELDIEWLDTQAVMRQTLKLMEERATQKGLSLLLICDPSTRVRADERAFKQIVLNLLSNAVKFTERGQVTIKLQNEPGGVLVAVEDTGCGIPPEQIDRVFQSFEQIDNHYARASGGTGLGLTLVRALAELHKGHCRIASEVGKGTCVEVYLPFDLAIADSHKVNAVSQAA
ncbi:MAG: HAMP domain-containing sensor histidine kinase [Micropepsaceae bacterium]